MFISRNPIIIKLVTYLFTILCTVFTILGIIVYFYLEDKRPFYYLVVPFLFIYDITWILTYFLYVKKLKWKI